MTRTQIRIGVVGMITVGVVCVTGIAAAESFQNGDFTWETDVLGRAWITGYVGSGGDVIIPNSFEGYPVHGIDDYAFQNCTNMYSVRLPDSLYVIGGGAFFHTGLSSIIIPANVSDIYAYAFSSCFMLHGVYFKGDAPTHEYDEFLSSDDVVVYRVSEASGWPEAGESWCDRPTALWSGALSNDWNYDYNGDGTSDIAIFRESAGLWAVRGITRAYFGSPADRPVPGDYDGDGTTDVGIFRATSGLWAVRGVTRVYFGSPSDLPVQGDYDADGTCDPAVYRANSGLWALRGISRIYFGSTNDTPIPMHYEWLGSVGSYPAIFRPASGLWAIKGISRAYFGSPGDIPVPGDYAGIRNWYMGIFRPSSGLWAVRELTRVYFGSSPDSPIPGGYAGGWQDYPGIYRSASGLWAVRGVTRVYFGSGSDIPVTR